MPAALIISLVLGELAAAPGQIADVKALVAAISAHPKASTILPDLIKAAEDFASEAKAVISAL